MNLQLSSYSYLLFIILTVFLLPQGTISSFRDEPHHLPYSLIGLKDQDEQGQQEMRLQEIPVDFEINCGEQDKVKTKDIPIPKNASFSGCKIEKDRRSPEGNEDVVGHTCKLRDSGKIVRVKYWCKEHPDCSTFTPDKNKDAPKSFFKGTIVIKAKKVESQQ